MKNNINNKDIRYLILSTIFLIFSFNLLMIVCYNKASGITNFAKLYFLISNVVFFIISLIYLIFTKYFLKLSYLYTGLTYSITSLQFLFMSCDVFLTALRFSKAIFIISILIIIYLIIVSLYLIAIKRKLKRKYIQSKTKINSKFIVLFSALGLLLGKMSINISEYIIIGYAIYFFSCVCTFGFYHLYMFWYYNYKQ